MRFYLHLTLLLGITLATPAYALLEKLPFFGTRFPFQVQVDNNPALSKQLAETVAAQREGSAEFDLYSQPASALQFDRTVLRKALESRGYYAAKIASKVDGETLIHHVQPGDLYRVAQVSFKFPQKVNPPSRYLLPLQEGSALDAAQVLNSLEVIRHQIQQEYCLFEVNLSYKAEVNHQTKEGFITYLLSPSQNVRFAAPQLVGEDGVAANYLKKQLTFTKGDCFNRTEIEKSRIALLQTNLLNRVEPLISEPVAGEVSVTFNVAERSHRTIKAGVGFATDIGGNLLLGWEHRNLFGSGQKLDTTLNYSKIEQSLEGTLTLPNFLRDDQVLVVESSLNRETPNAYKSTNSEVTATVSRSLFQHVTASVGTGLEFSRVEKDGEVEDYGLLSFPLGLSYNSTNNIFDPQQGVAVALTTRPYINLYQTGVRWVEHSALLSTYVTATDWPLQPTLAFRLAAGTLNDASLDEVPADHRFYIGGGGSVRGYDYQSVSALDEGEPIGGLSFSESSLEVRLKFNESWGGVLFVDGGYAYTEQTPKFYQDYLWAAGIGIRFFTSFAPIRLDIARPLDIRYTAETGARVDPPFQIYISLGQAF